MFSALLHVFSALQRCVSSPSEVVCAFAYSVMCASTLQVVFASTLLVVFSWWGGGGHVALLFRRSDQCCVSLFVGHAGGHSSLYGAFALG